MNVQYDVYKNTKDILKAVRSEHKDRLQTQLQSQGAILSFVIDHSLNVTKSIWTSVQSKMPKNIFNFTIRYLNNSLSTRSNLKKWNFTQSSDCSFCHLPETLLHVVAGCKSYLEEGPLYLASQTLHYKFWLTILGQLQDYHFTLISHAFIRLAL